MLEKLTQAIIDDKMVGDNVAKKLAQALIDRYDDDPIRDDEIEWILDNIRIFDTMQQAILYELEDRDIYITFQYLTELDIKQDFVGKSMAQVWLEDMDFHKLDIEDADIWFTIYD